MGLLRLVVTIVVGWGLFFALLVGVRTFNGGQPVGSPALYTCLAAGLIAALATYDALGSVL